jgi:hypothetical protein
MTRLEILLSNTKENQREMVIGILATLVDDLDPDDLAFLANWCGIEVYEYRDVPEESDGFTCSREDYEYEQARQAEIDARYEAA